jgi:hypothetical protein
MDTFADSRARRPSEFPSPSSRGRVRGISARLRTNAVMTGLVPVIHVVQLPKTFRSAGSGAAWMAGTSPETSPAMTKRAAKEAHTSAAAIRSGALDAARRPPHPRPLPVRTGGAGGGAGEPSNFGGFEMTRTEVIPYIVYRDVPAACGRSDTARDLEGRPWFFTQLDP